VSLYQSTIITTKSIFCCYCCCRCGQGEETSLREAQM